MTEQPHSGDDQDSKMEEANKSFFIMRIIHFALVAGLVMFGGVVLMISGKGISMTPSFRNPIILIAAVFCVLTLAVSSGIHLIYRRIAAPASSIRSALQKYQVFCMVRWAVIEGGALFSAVVALITKNVLPIGLFVISLAMLISRYPSQKEFVSLSSEGNPAAPLAGP